MAWDDEFGKLVAAIDTQVRLAGIRAHQAAVEEIVKTRDVEIGGVRIPKETLIPREVFTGRRVVMETTVFLRDTGVSLTRGLRSRTPAKITIEWEAEPSPEATSLVRTKAEAHLDGKLRTIPMIPITPAKPKENDDG